MENSKSLSCKKKKPLIFHTKYIAPFLFCFLILSGCTKETTEETNDNTPKLFAELPASYTGIHFQNDLEFTEEFNVYTYRNFYNGAGVGLADINNDGLVDVFFSGNLVDNKLYLNKGNFKFEDITEKAGVACKNVWTSGVSMADINGDGLIDIYVCKSGSPGGDNRHNELFINNGDLTFTEKSREFGIADEGLSTHAAFFDFDKDGDLDLYLLNNSFRPIGIYDLRPGQREKRDPDGGNKLYQNDNNKFTDISEAAGIYGSAIGFGLGVTIGDVNKDGWQDIFVSNDFFEKDYLYINQQNGTFKESLESHMQEISLGSMGADMADLNNDGYPEIFVTDMLPDADRRIKTKTAFESFDKYQLNIRNGYYRQFTRNMLHLNNGLVPNKSNVHFSEVSRLAGVHATDWSWGALIADFDNDGNKDIFVANGIYKDLTDQDYVNFYSDPNKVRALMKTEESAILTMIDNIPSERISNYAFKNNGDLKFEDKTKAWGLATPSHSNGSAYADLDNDGDLDLIVNNNNMPPFVYRNESVGNNYLSIKLVGTQQNKFAIGAQVTLYVGNQLFYQELAPMRGFESTCDHRLHFGLGEFTSIDSIHILWPTNEVTKLYGQSVNQLLEINVGESKQKANKKFAKSKQQIFKEIPQANLPTHTENDFIDFDRDQLMYHMVSREGPRIAVADVNKDGLEDFYLCGAKDQSGQLFFQQKDGNFKNGFIPAFEKDKKSEDTDAIFFDANNDGYVDLYVTSGGNEFPSASSALADRLYLNDGKGSFSNTNQILPIKKYESSGCVDAADYDKDGDVDLFVGIRLRPFLYGVPNNGYILDNDGKGNFSQNTSVSSALKELGLIKDAKWNDYDQDGDMDLVIVGEWMPVYLLENNAGKFTKKEIVPNSNGLWNCINAADLDNDGDLDFLVGNHGLNSKIKANATHPATMYINDFDRNGSAEQILCLYENEAAYPFALRHDLIKQIPSLKKKYLKYENYVEQTITDIFTPEQLENAVALKAFEMNTGIFWNNGASGFEFKALPVEAQYAPMYGLIVDDFDGDENPDILIGGNFMHAKPEIGINAASYGLLLKGDGKQNFKSQAPTDSGLFITGEIRGIEKIKIGNKNHLIIAKNNEQVKIYEYE